MKKNENGSQSKNFPINPQSNSYFRDDGAPVEGMFINYFNLYPDLVWTFLEVDKKIVQDYFLSSKEWEKVVTKADFNNFVKKRFRKLMTERGLENVEDDLVHNISDILLFVNDDIGFVRFEIEHLGGNSLLLEDDPENKDHEDDELPNVFMDIAFFNTKKAKRVMDEIVKGYFAFEEEESETAKVNVISHTGTELTLREFDIDYDDIDFEKQYNDGFYDFHCKVLNSINDNEERSFFIINGDAGTGKTSYIRYLMGTLDEDKNVIYLPPNMIGTLADPNFIDFMSKNSHSVLIIEDGEEVVEKKAEGRDAAVNNLLNITDGILGNCLKLDIICTFNAPIHNLDPALTRKGRLNGRFKVGPLEKKKAENLCKEMGTELPEKEQDWTLGNIMNGGEDDPNDVEGGDDSGFGFNSKKSNK